MTTATQPEVGSEPPVDLRPAYLTAAQVGEVLQLSAKSVYRLAKDNPTMPMLKLGGTLRFPRERLERWLRDREQGSPRPRRVQTTAEMMTHRTTGSGSSDRAGLGPRFGRTPASERNSR